MGNSEDSYLRFLQGDTSGLEEIVREYNDGLVLFVNGFVGDLSTAEDIVADTFVELLVKKSKFRKRALFKTWLYRIARNNALDYLRKQERRYTWLLDDGTESFPTDHFPIGNDPMGDSLEQIVLEDEQKSQLYKAMSQLHSEYRQVLYLLYFEEMSYEQTAAVMRKNKKQIKNLAYRGRQALKVDLEKEGFTYAEL